MNCLEFALNYFRGNNFNNRVQKITIEFGENTSLKIIHGDMVYDGSWQTTEEAFMSAMIYFESRSQYWSDGKLKEVKK